MGNRVTIIVGAGAVLDFDHKGIFSSVKNITDEVLKQLSIQNVDGEIAYSGKRIKIPYTPKKVAVEFRAAKLGELCNQTPGIVQSNSMNNSG